MGCSKDDTPEVKTRDVSFKVCVSCDDLIMNDYYGSTLVQSVHNRQVIIPLNQSALHWLPERNGCKPSQKVFELTILGVCNRYLKKMAADAGITKNVSFHTSRHTSAVLTLAAGGDLYTVGKLLGHTSINSTQVYADVVMETKVEAIRESDALQVTKNIILYIITLRRIGGKFKNPELLMNKAICRLYAISGDAPQ